MYEVPVAIRRDGVWSSLTAGREMADWLAFEDEFGSVDFDERSVRKLLFIVHLADRPDVPFDEWLKGVEVVCAEAQLDDDVRAELGLDKPDEQSEPDRPTPLPARPAQPTGAIEHEPVAAHAAS